MQDQDSTQKPSKLLYPTEYWPAKDGVSPKVFEDFISRLEKYLGVQRTKVSLEQTWQKHRPAGVIESLSEYGSVLRTRLRMGGQSGPMDRTLSRLPSGIRSPLREASRAEFSSTVRGVRVTAHWIPLKMI